MGLFGSGTIILLGVYKEGKLPSKDKIVKLISQFILGGIGACIFILLGFPNNFNSFLMGCIALKFLSEIIEKINIHKLMNGEEKNLWRRLGECVPISLTRENYLLKIKSF